MPVSRVILWPWFAIIPVLVSAALGLWGLNTPGLWYDERVTAETTQLGPFIYPWDIAISPYYVTAWVWTGGGALDSDWWLRGLSLFATLIAVAATSSAARQLSGARAGLAAGLFLALMPGVARYSQEARVYAISLSLAALSTWLLVEYCQRNKHRWMVGYAATLFLLAPLAPFALTIVVGHGIVLIFRRQWRSNLRVWLVALLALVPGLSLQLYGASRASSQHDWIPSPTPEGLMKSIVWPGALPGGGDVAVTISAVVVVALVLGIISRSSWVWVAAAGSGLLVLWAVSEVFINFWIVRSALPLAVFLALGAGIALAQVSPRQIVAVAAVLAVVDWSQYASPRQEGGRAEDVKVAARIVDDQGIAGDTINTKSRGWLEFGVRRYSADPERFIYSDSSTGRAWVFSGDAREINCRKLNEWDIPGNGLLTLCESLPPKWSAKFQ